MSSSLLLSLCAVLLVGVSDVVDVDGGREFIIYWLHGVVMGRWFKRGCVLIFCCCFCVFVFVCLWCVDGKNVYETDVHHIY